MANKLIDTLTMPDGVSYDIEAKYFGGLESTDFAKASDLRAKADKYVTSEAGIKFNTLVSLPDYFYNGGSYAELVTFSDGTKLLWNNALWPAEMQYEDVSGSITTVWRAETGWLVGFIPTDEPVTITHMLTAAEDYYLTVDLSTAVSVVGILVDPEYNYKHKADIYEVSASAKKLSQIQVGMDLSGVLLTFTGDAGYVSGDITNTILFGKETVDGYPKYKIMTYRSAGETMYNYFGLYEYKTANSGYMLISTWAQNSSSGQGWVGTSYTFPTNGTGRYVITEITGDINKEPFTLVACDIPAANINVDCEYNYHKIQALEEIVDGLNAGGSSSSTQAGNGIYYGTCTTAYNTAAKTVTVDDSFELKTGAVVAVKFSSYNSASNPTLNVNNTGAKRIYAYGTTTTGLTASRTGWQSNAIVIFVYDGSAWIRNYWTDTDTYPTPSNVSQGQGYGTCSTAANTTAKTVSLTNYALSTGGIVAVKFTYDVPAGATLNINSKGAKSIYYRGAAITDGIIKAGDTATFIYNGTYYHLLTVDRATEEVVKGEIVDMVDLRPGDIVGENCAIYFPVGDVYNSYFYGETSSMLYDSNLIEFSDGTKIYGKADEGTAIYISYQGGQEETLWSSGAWAEAGKNARLAESSKYILEKGTKVVANNMYLYDCRGEFFVSNAITTTKNTMYPNFSSERRPYEALSEKIIAWSGEKILSEGFKAPFVVQGYVDTTVYPAATVDVKIVPEIWMRVIKLGNDSGYAYAFAEVDSAMNLTALGVYTDNKIPNRHINPTSALASSEYASYAIRKRLDGVHLLYLASDSTSVEREPFYLPIGSRMVNFEKDGYYPWILAFSDQYTGTTSLKTIGLAAGTYNRIETNNWGTTGTTITIDETQVEEFSKLFKILDNVFDLDTPATEATNSVLKTVSPVEIPHGYTDWLDLPSITIDITKERVAGIWGRLSGYTNYNFYFTVEELRAVGMAADITAILTSLDNLPTNMAFDAVEESLSIGYSGDSICNARLNVVRGSCPTYTYNWQIKLNWGTYPSSAYTVGYVVETLVPDANNSYGYTY